MCDLFDKFFSLSDFFFSRSVTRVTTWQAVNGMNLTRTDFTKKEVIKSIDGLCIGNDH
jgi:hypothetical protein